MSEPLAANSNISHYRIVSKIGAGGMGEVYLALDAQLDRTVALKILPSNVASHGERMRRFIQEAKAPLDDTPPKQLTNFKTEDIHNFDWSADGKQLVLARGPVTSDVFLIRDFR